MYVDETGNHFHLSLIALTSVPMSQLALPTPTLPLFTHSLLQSVIDCTERRLARRPTKLAAGSDRIREEETDDVVVVSAVCAAACRSLFLRPAPARSLLPSLPAPPAAPRPPASRPRPVALALAPSNVEPPHCTRSTREERYHNAAPPPNTHTEALTDCDSRPRMRSRRGRRPRRG